MRHEAANYRADVDGLRALAVVPVVFFHAGLPGFDGGFIGVDVFFVISGFVISLSIKRELEAGRFSLSGFYERRIRRILPALTCVVLASVAAALWLAPPFLFGPFARSVSATAVFASNVFFWKDIGYFNSEAPFRALLHSWSLAVEEQYYIVAPLLFMLVHRWLGARWRLALLPVLVASFALSVYAIAHNHLNAAFFSLPTRVWEPLLGALIAFAPMPLPPRAFREAAGLIGIAGLAIPVALYDYRTPFPGIAALAPCLGAALLITIGASEKPAFATRLLQWRPFVAIGKVSYSLYLVHWPLIVIIQFILFRRLNPLEAGGVMLVSLLLAALSYKFIEQPMRRLPAPRIGVFGAGAGAILIMAAIGWLSPHLNARIMAGRPDAHYTQDWNAVDAQFGGPTCFLDSGAEARVWTYDSCVRTHGGAEDILLWGDSFAAHYLPGLQANDARIGGRIVQYTMQGCPALPAGAEALSRVCADFSRQAFEVIAQHHIRRVVLSGSWVEYDWRQVETVAHTVRRLRAMGLDVVVIGQSPFFYADPFLFAARGESPHAGNLSLTADAEGAALNARLGPVVQAAGANFIDPIQIMCGEGGCPIRSEGRDLFVDYGHFSAAGSAFAVGAYFPFMNRPSPPADGERPIRG